MTELIAFTKRGAKLADRLCVLLPGAAAYAPARYAVGRVMPLSEPLTVWTAARFRSGNSLVFIGAAGIAVRAISPHVRAKDLDPAVLCIDEAGRFVIPLLSGHIGGANTLAREIARLLGAQAVVTTATDVNGVFSPDAWASQNGLLVADTAAVKYVSAALLDGETVGFVSDEFPVVTPLPAGIVTGMGYRCGIEIALCASKPFVHTLHLIPRCIIAGIGCRRGISVGTITRRLRETLAAHGLPEQSVGMVATIDLKKDEPGLLELCTQLRAPLQTFSPQVLMSVEGDFTTSERVLRETGADNVCERAAVQAGGSLICKKTAGDGVTVALARKMFAISFD